MSKKKKCDCKCADTPPEYKVVLNSVLVNSEGSSVEVMQFDYSVTWAEHLLQFRSALLGLGFLWNEEQEEHWRALINNFKSLY